MAATDVGSTNTEQLDAQDQELFTQESDLIELVPLDSLTEDMVGHWTYLILEASAFLMQGMHPVIADVVERYSVARTDPAGRGIRSIDSVLRWVYGGQEAIEEGRRLRLLHQPLKMKNAAGKQISALNPGAYQWVIATAYATTVKAGPLLIGRDFTAEEQDELLRDNRRLARLLHVPMKGYPATRAEYETYFDDMISTTLVPTPAVLEGLDNLRNGRTEALAGVPAPLRPIVRLAIRPLLRVTYLSMVGVMDERIRTMLGVTWTPSEQSRLELMFGLTRLAYRVLPDRVTYFPLAYHARKHHQCIQQMKQRELKSAAYKVRPKQSTTR